MRLIDADELVKALDEALKEQMGIMDILSKQLLVNFAKQILSDAPTVEAVPVKYGHWCFEEFPDGYYHWECSECKKWFKEDSMSLVEEWKYCPNCGVKMDEEGS